jgi:hypothetical protein
MYVNRRSREIRAPIHMGFLGKPKHQVGIGVPEFRSEVLLFRHHVAHRTRLWNLRPGRLQRSRDSIGYEDYGAKCIYSVPLHLFLPRAAHTTCILQVECNICDTACRMQVDKCRAWGTILSDAT